MSNVGESKMDYEQSSGSTVDDLIDINQLRYYLKSDLSVVQRRYFSKNYFTNQAYSNTNRSAVCTISSGSDFIGDAFLRFKVTIQNSIESSNVYLTSGVNMINSLLIRARDGTEISRINKSKSVSKPVN